MKPSGFHLRRALDLNGPSTGFLKLIGLFVGVIPIVLYSISFVWKSATTTIVLYSMIRISLAIGVFVFIVFLLLVILEQIQDHYFDVRYRKNRARKLPLADGKYECQYCGSRNVKENDRTCQVCGKELK